jgi:hypothetical protein
MRCASYCSFVDTANLRYIYEQQEDSTTDANQVCTYQRFISSPYHASCMLQIVVSRVFGRGTGDSTLIDLLVDTNAAIEALQQAESAGEPTLHSCDNCPA